jgi:hypothetical protein
MNYDFCHGVFGFGVNRPDGTLEFLHYFEVQLVFFQPHARGEIHQLPRTAGSTSRTRQCLEPRDVAETVWALVGYLAVDRGN